MDIDSLDLTGKRILVVDDVKINRLILNNILSEKGAEIVEASDGGEAVNIFSADPRGIDIILMDIMMPNMDGYQAARAIRTLETGSRRIPIIAVTALSYSEDRDAVIDAGMDFHLEKPVEPESLLTCIARFI